MIEDQLPSPQIDVKVLIPYTQGDLLARIYKEGHLLSRTDTENGYLIVAKVPENLAIQLDQLS
jgi:GTP-binding protein HflX